MSSQPPPGSTGGSPRIPAPNSTHIWPRTPDLTAQSTGGMSLISAALTAQSTGRSPQIRKAFYAQSTGGIPQIRKVFSAQSTPGFPRIPFALQKRTVLVDWWLERVEGEEGKVRVAGTTHTPQMRHLWLERVEGEEGKIRVAGTTHTPQMRNSKGNRNVAGRVFRSSAIVKRHDDFFTVESEDGFHIQIGSLLNTPKTLENGFSVEVCKCFEFGFPSEWQTLVNPKMVLDTEHARSPSETTTSAARVEYFMKKFLSDDFAKSITYDSTQTRLCLPDDNAGSISARWGFSVPGMDEPEKPLAPPGEACNKSQANDTIQQESMHSCSSEHGMVTLPVDRTSSQLGDPEILKSGKDPVSLGTTDALELPTKLMTPKLRVIGRSEDSIGRRLRSGKVTGIAPPKRPPKKAKTEADAAPAAPKPAPKPAPAPAPTGDSSTLVKRGHGHGRPPKVRPVVPGETAAA